MHRIPVTLSLLALGATGALADVNIYTTRQPELIQPAITKFTEETGIRVNLAFVEGGIVERLQAEGARSPADLVITTDIASLLHIVEGDVIQPVESKVLSSTIPDYLRDPENKWFALTERARVVYASDERVAEGELSSYEELANPKWKGRICTRSGLHDYNLALLSAMIVHHGEDAARDWAEGVKANLARRPEGNDRAQVKAIWAGECDISLGNTYYMGQMLTDDEQQEWASAVDLVFPKFEDGGTHVNISGVAMTKAAPNRDEAVQFMEFMVGPEAQEIYAQVNYEYPINPEVEASELVSGWGELDADTISLTDLAAARPTALKIMEEVDFDG